MGIEFCMNCMEPRMPGANICPCCGFSAENGVISANMGTPINLIPGYILDGKYVIGNSMGRMETEKENILHSFRYIAYDLETNQKADIWEYFPTAYNSAARRCPDGSLLWNNELTAKRLPEGQKLEEVFSAFAARTQITARVAPTPAISKYMQTDFSSFCVNNTIYVAAPHMQGLRLTDLIRLGQNMNIQKYLSLFLEMMEALSDLHAQGICHGSISTDTILLSRGKLILTGLGMPDGFTVPDLCDPEDPDCKAGLHHRPVLPHKERELNMATDVFQLSVAIYSCLFGRLNPTIRRTETGKVVFPKRIDPKLARVLNKGLRRDLDKRYKDIVHFRRALLQAIADSTQEGR